MNYFQYLGGGMRGADIAVGWVDSSGTLTIQVKQTFGKSLAAFFLL